MRLTTSLRRPANRNAVPASKPRNLVVQALSLIHI